MEQEFSLGSIVFLLVNIEWGTLSLSCGFQIYFSNVLGAIILAFLAMLKMNKRDKNREISFMFYWMFSFTMYKPRVYMQIVCLLAKRCGL